MCKVINSQRFLERKLRAVNIDVPSNIVKSFKVLVLKLEEEYIRHYTIVERQTLRDLNSIHWVPSLRRYCNSLGVSISDNFFINDDLTLEGIFYILNKLTSIALEEEYVDLASDSQLESFDNSNYLDLAHRNLDIMKEKVNHIFECLDIPPLGSHSSVGEVRSAIELLLELFYRWSHETSKGNTQDVEFMIDLGEVPSGIISEKRTVVTATRILRALHSKELSRLQDEIIWLTERFQQLTANPCTNIKSS